MVWCSVKGKAHGQLYFNLKISYH